MCESDEHERRATVAGNARADLSSTATVAASSQEPAHGNFRGVGGAAAIAGPPAGRRAQQQARRGDRGRHVQRDRAVPRAHRRPGVPAIVRGQAAPAVDAFAAVDRRRPMARRLRRGRARRGRPPRTTSDHPLPEGLLQEPVDVVGRPVAAAFFAPARPVRQHPAQPVQEHVHQLLDVRRRRSRNRGRRRRGRDGGRASRDELLVGRTDRRSGPRRRIRNDWTPTVPRHERRVGVQRERHEENRTAREKHFRRNAKTDGTKRQLNRRANTADSE